MADVGLQFVELVGDTEEERTVDFIYGTTFGNGETVVRVAKTHFIAGVDLVADDADFRGFHNTLHKEGASSYQPHLNGDGEVVGRIVGANSPDKFIAGMRRLLANASKAAEKE